MVTERRAWGSDPFTNRTTIMFWPCSIHFWRFSAWVHCKRWVFDFIFGLLECSRYLYTCSTEHVPFCIPPPQETRSATYVRRAASLMESNYHRTNRFHTSELICLIVFGKTTDGVDIQETLRSVGTPQRSAVSSASALFNSKPFDSSTPPNLHTKCHHRWFRHLMSNSCTRGAWDGSFRAWEICLPQWRLPASLLMAHLVNNTHSVSKILFFSTSRPSCTFNCWSFPCLLLNYSF